MKLYVLEVGVVSKVRNEQRHYPLLTKFKLTLEGSNRLDDDGDWSVPDAASSYFGQSSGFWTTKTNGGFKELWLMEDEDPNMISWLWRKTPQGLAQLDGILKLPLFLGETGTGFILPIGLPDYSISWKVVDRGF